MAISSNSKINWSDIQTIFTNLNTARKKFFPSQSDFQAAPGGQSTQAMAQLAQNLNKYIESFSSSGYVGSRANISENPPSAGDLISPIIFNRFTTTIRSINDTCAHDASYNASHRGSGYNSSWDSSDYGAGWDTSYNSSHDGSSYHSSYWSGVNQTWCSSHGCSSHYGSRHT